MTGDRHVGFFESERGRFPPATHQASVAVLDDRLLVEELFVGISIPGIRLTVSQMARLVRRHPRFDPMKLKALGLRRFLSATVWLPRDSVGGVLPVVLDHDNVGSRTFAVK